MACKCTMAQSLVGDGCDICNPEMAEEHAALAAFDDFFDNEGFKEEHREVFEGVWMAALATKRLQKAR